MKKSIHTALLLFIYSFCVWGQNSYVLHSPEFLPGNVLSVELPDHQTLIIRTLGFEDVYKKYPYIQFVLVDECGIKESYAFSCSDISSIMGLDQAILRGDLLYLAIEAIDKKKSQVETGILILDLTSKSTKYMSIKTTDVMYNLDFNVLSDGSFMLYNFMSFTSKEPAYGIFLLDPDFNIIDYFEFDYDYYSITGNCKKTDGGWICTYGFSIIYFDKYLHPQWAIENKDRNAYWQMEMTNDGFFVRTSIYINFIRNMSLNKFDFMGNLVWRTPNLAKSDFTTGTSSTSWLTFRPDSLLDMIVSNSDFQNKKSEIFRYVIRPDNGDLILQNQLMPTTVGESFNFRKYNTLTDGTHQILLENNTENHVLIQFKDEELRCLDEDTTAMTNAAPIVFQPKSIPERRFSTYQTNSYIWSEVDLPLLTQVNCEEIYNFKDLISTDTTGCSEKGVVLDISALELPAKWNDGDTNKVKYFQQPGLYRYETSYCQQNFEEEINIDFDVCECNFILPNVIDPANGGENGNFKMNEICEFAADFQMMLFDRWGNVIFEASTQDFSWDGKINGNFSLGGVYTYRITYQNLLRRGERSTKYGTLTLLN